MYDKVAKNAEARQQLSKCGNSLDIEEEAIEELFEFICLVICGDKVSRTMGTARAANWKVVKKSFAFHQMWIACVNIAFVRTTLLIWCITPP